MRRSSKSPRAPAGARHAADLAVTAILVATACAGGSDADRAAPAVVIRNVTVIPLTAGGARLTSATVIIEGDRIVAIGGTPESEVETTPAATEIPEADIPPGADIIDGTGRYLIPGLIEMHAHTSKTRASSLGLYVVNGVTTVRDMGGDHEELLGWRREIRTGQRLGPRMLVAGPYLESVANVERMRRTPPADMVEPVERTRIPVGSPSEADRLVDSLAGLELEFIKIRTVTDRATYLALNDAANRNGVPLVGHVFGIPPETILEAGQDGIEHSLYPTLDSLSRDERMDVWRDFAAAGIRIVPTLVTFTASVLPGRARLEALVADSAGELDPRRAYISRFLELDWGEQAAEVDDARVGLFRGLWPANLRNLREMHEAGVDILAGSDVAVIGIFPGWSLHDELELFVDSLGMTPAEALVRATRKSAEFLGVADSVGTIAEGRVADLVLLDGDPVEDVRNTRRIAAVILRGTPYREEDLERILQQALAAPDQRTNDWPRTGSAADSTGG